jgi:hypothetical protein
LRGGNGNPIRPEVGVWVDSERLECIDGLRLKADPGSSKSDRLECMLGLRRNVDDLTAVLTLALLWRFMAARAHTSNASTLSRSGILALVST